MSLRLLQMLAHEPPPVMLALSSDGACGASLDPTGVVRSWKVGAVPVVRSTKPCVTVIAFADPTTLLLGDTRGGVRAVDPAEGQVRWEVLRHKGAVRGMALQGDELVTVGEDGSLRVGSAAAAKPRLVVRRSKAFTSLSRSPTGDIVAGSEGRSLTVWTLREKSVIERFSDRSSWAPAEQVFFLDRGRHVLTTHGTSERLWDIGGRGMLRGGGNSYIVYGASDPVGGRFVVARNNEVSVMALSGKAAPED